MIVFSLKCWECNSLTSAFCDDPFNTSSSLEQSKFWALTECKKPQFASLRHSAVCVKMHLNNTIVNRTMIHRSCLWENLGEACTFHDADTKELVTKCEACNNADGCNGAGNMESHIGLFLLLPALMNARYRWF